MDRCLWIQWEKTIHLLQVSLYKHLLIFYAVHLTFLWHNFFFVMNFILPARDKTKKYLPVSQRKTSNQNFCLLELALLYINSYRTNAPIPLIAYKKGLRKRASAWNELTLVNYKIVLEWNTQYCMQKASFCCLILSLLLTKQVFQITYRDMLMLVI